MWTGVFSLLISTAGLSFFAKPAVQIDPLKIKDIKVEAPFDAIHTPTFLYVPAN